MCPRVVRLRRRSGWRRPTSADRVGICRYDTPTHTPIVWACLTTALAHLWVPLEPPNLHANLHQPARALGTDMPDPPSHYSGVATVSGHALGIGGSIMGDPLAPNRVHSRWLGVQVDRQTCRLTPCFLAGRYGLPRGRPECHLRRRRRQRPDAEHRHLVRAWRRGPRHVRAVSAALQSLQEERGRRRG